MCQFVEKHFDSKKTLESYTDKIHRLNKNNKLGVGSFSKVYKINDQLALKVGKDLGYLEYVKAISEFGNGNPMLPVIHKAIVCKVDNAVESCIYYTELLEPRGDSERRRKLRDILHHLENNEDWRKELSNLKLDKQTKHAIEVIMIARDNAMVADPGVIIDLQCYNVMWRNDQMVITDPIA